MDPNRFKEAYARLEILDDRLTYKVRSGTKGRGTSPEQLDVRIKDVAEFVLELKDIMRELMLAIAGKPAAKAE